MCVCVCVCGFGIHPQLYCSDAHVQFSGDASQHSGPKQEAQRVKGVFSLCGMLKVLRMLEATVVE